MILELLKENYQLTPKDENLIKVLTLDLPSTKKLEYVVSELVKNKLDFNSAMAYVFKQYFDIKGLAETEKLLPSTNDEVRKIFGALKTLRGTISVKRNEEVEDLRKMFIAMSADLRVIFIKLFSIKYDLMNLKTPLKPHEFGFVNDVKTLYAPLAERLGLNKVKSELEDLCLFYQEPEIYKYLEENSMLKKDENDKQLAITKERFEKILKELGIKGEIVSRIKHFSSVYKKMKTKNVTLAQIYDLIAMRILVNSIEDCYAVLGKIHEIYKPIPDRVKDYIATPKANGYSSLHTTVIVENLRPIEIQIRTHEMHRISEYGFAAHWMYKEKRAKSNSLDVKIGWIREIMEGAESLDQEDFIETLKTNLYSGEIFVQTPKGKVLEFPEGASVIDFAYAIHSDIGNSCVGAKINSKMCPLITKLKTGDIVEIITNPNSKGPSRDWLKHIKTSGARNKINLFFKRELKDENVKRGKVMIDELIKDRKLSHKELFTSKYEDELKNKYSFKSLEELYASVGYGSMTAAQVINTLVNFVSRDKKPEPKMLQSKAISVKANKDGVLIDGETGMAVRYAGCCNPIAPENIIGYISVGRGVTIHKESCANLKYLEKERLIPAEWQNGESKNVITNLKIYAENRAEVIPKIVARLSAEKCEIRSLDSRVTPDGIHVTVRVIAVNKEDVAKAIKELTREREIFEVVRD